MSDRDDFAAGLANAQDALLERDDGLEVARAALLSRSAAPKRRSGPLVAAVALPVLAMAAAAIFWVSQPPVDAILVSVNGQAQQTGDWISAADTPVPVAFSDGSQMTLQAGGRARLQELGEHRVELSLERGVAHFDVVHAEATDWRIHAGPFEVHVTGTVFDANWQPDTEVFTLEMAEGQVFVSGPHLGEGRHVEDAEALQVWLTEGRSALTVGGVPAPEQAVVRVPDPELVPTEPPVAKPARRDAAPTSARVRVTVVEDEGAADEAAPVAWQTLVQQGAYAEAVALVEQHGVDQALAEGSAADLVALGDAARLSKQYRLSEAAYTAVRDRYPGGVAAANGAFSLGRMAFDQRGQMDQAVRWLRVYVAEQPDGVLLREALGRLMEAESKRGERGAARDVAADYLARFPDGPHAQFARGLVKRRRP